MPPVLNVSLDELTGCRVQDVFPNESGSRQQQRQRILQLIAEPERAARLVESRSSPDPARQRLVEQPAVQHQVHRTIRRPDVDYAKKIVPIRCRPAERLVHDVAIAVPLDEIPRVRLVLGIAKDANQYLFFAGTEVDTHANRPARIERRPHAV